MRKKLHLMLASIYLVTLCFYSPLYGQKSVQIGKTATAPVLDGVAEALWDDAPRYIAVDPHSWCYDGWVQGWFGREVSMQSDEDFSMNWKAVWDDTNLYFLLEFTDDVVTTGDVAGMGAAEKLWMMDCAEVKIGDYFYRFGYDRDDEIFQRPTEGQFNPGGYTQKSALTTGGYIIEAQIPWSTLNNDSVTIGLDPDAGTEFMLWASGADLDNPAGKAWNDQDGHIHWPIDNGKEKVVLAATAAIDNTAPAVPQNLASSDIAAESAKLSWDAVSDADIRGYVVMDGDIRIKYVLDNVTDHTVTLAEETDYSFKVKANDGQNLSGASNAVNISTKTPPPDIFIGMTDAAITIDGVRESSWGAAPQYVAVDPTTWTPNPDHQSLADCSFKWSALWDEDNLYILVNVLDDIVTTGDTVAEGSSAKSWMNDNVEMSIAPIDGTGDAWFFRFGYNREPLDLGLLDSPAKNTPVGSHYATAEQTDGWVMEAAIPWKILSIDPENFTGWAEIDKVMNVGIYVADLDDPAASAWDKLSGHVQWPKGWSTADITLAETVTIDPIAPAAPAGLTATDITITSAKLSWSASSEADVAGYLVMKGDAPFVYTAANSVDLGGLSAATEYTFSVYAVDPQNISDESVPVTFSTSTPPALKSITIPQYAGSYPNPFDDLDYWELLNPNGLEYGTPPSDDFACSFKSAWDEDNLYMQISLVDPPPVVNGKTNPWENDNTEVHFDLQNAKDGTSCEDVDGDLYQKDNMQYRFIAYEPARQHGSTPAPNWTNLTQVDYDLYDAAGTTIIGWYVEVTFPWATLNLTAAGYFTFEPALGKKIGVEVHAFDYDTDASSGGSIWSSYEQLPPNRDNTQYGEFILGGTSSIQNPETQLIRMYPNPADLEIQLVIPGEGFDLTLTDLTGRNVMQINSLSSGLNRIDIRELPSGIYMVSLQNGNEYYRSKLIKN